MTITSRDSRELNRLTNERNLFNAQLGVVLPAMHYLLKRLSAAKVACTKYDAAIVESVNLSLRARTDEEVETIVNAHNNNMMEDITSEMSSGKTGEDALRKLFESLRGADPAQSADAEDPRDGEDPFDKMDEDDFRKHGDGYGEPGFDDFRDENGNDNWPNN